MVSDVQARVLEVLRGHRQRALFLSELLARLSSFDRVAVEQAVAAMDRDRILVVSRSSPDPHFQGDLRIVTLREASGPGDADAAAERAAEFVWSTWLRDVLAHHRCC